MSDLKPCPFCGAKAEFRDDGENGSPYWVSCYDCSISTAEFDDPEWPVFEWNTRPDKELIAEVEKLRTNMMTEINKNNPYGSCYTVVKASCNQIIDDFIKLLDKTK
jgi:hypothetical protein